MHSRNGLRIFLVLGALGLGQTCGGGSPTAAPTPAPVPATTPPPPPATLADLSAAVTSPEAEASLTCADNVHARVTLTNRALSGVLVTGVLKKSSVAGTGDCFAGRDFVYNNFGRTVGPGSTAGVLDGPLYNGGVGCCLGTHCAGNCTFIDTFDVLTEVGSVPAGAIRYKVFFQNCPSCAGSASAQSCPAPHVTAAGAR